MICCTLSYSLFWRKPHLEWFSPYYFAIFRKAKRYGYLLDVFFLDRCIPHLISHTPQTDVFLTLFLDIFSKRNIRGHFQRLSVFCCKRNSSMRIESPNFLLKKDILTLISTEAERAVCGRIRHVIFLNDK